MNIIKDFPLRIDKEETPERILKAALSTWEGLTDVVIIGVIKDDVVVSGSSVDVLKILGLIELGKHEVLTSCEE